MLEGIQITPLKRRFDERGFFLELMRTDWKEIFHEHDIVQANLSMSYPGIIRAWHRHLRGQVDHFIALQGAMKICAYDEETGELNEIISTGNYLQIVRLPGEYWHGFKVVSNEPAWLLYFVNRLYDYKKPDEERRLWNDQTIIPKSINGKTDDPRIGKPWNWNYPPHK
jgi:dTDP-4-dehydrorhamnose 3,5-epimerase